QPEHEPARIDGGDAVDRGVRQPHQHGYAEYERHADAQQTVLQKRFGAFAPEARPHEQTGKQEHQLHQAEKFERTDQVEPEPAMAVDDRVRRPTIRGAVEGQRGSRLRNDVGDEGMEDEHVEDDETAQIMQSQAGFGHAGSGPPPGSVQSQIRDSLPAVANAYAML